MSDEHKKDNAAHLKYRLDSFSALQIEHSSVDFNRPEIKENPFMLRLNKIEGLKRSNKCALNASIHCFALQPVIQALVRTAGISFGDNLKKNVIEKAKMELKKTEGLKHLYSPYRSGLVDEDSIIDRYSDESAGPLAIVLLHLVLRGINNSKYRANILDYNAKKSSHFLYSTDVDEFSKTQVVKDSGTMQSKIASLVTDSGFCSLMLMGPHVMFAIYILAVLCYGEEAGKEMVTIMTVNSEDDIKHFDLYLEGMFNQNLTQLQSSDTIYDAQQYFDAINLDGFIPPTHFLDNQDRPLFNVHAQYINDTREWSSALKKYTYRTISIYNMPLMLTLHINTKFDRFRNFMVINLPPNFKTGTIGKYYLTGVILRGLGSTKSDDGHYSYLHMVLYDDYTVKYIEYDNLEKLPIPWKAGEFEGRIKSLIYTREDCVVFVDSKQKNTSGYGESDDEQKSSSSEEEEEEEEDEEEYEDSTFDFEGISTSLLDLNTLDNDNNLLMFKEFCKSCNNIKNSSLLEIKDYDFTNLMEYVNTVDFAKLKSQVPMYGLGIYYIGRYFNENPLELFNRNKYIKNCYQKACILMDFPCPGNRNDYIYTYTNEDTTYTYSADNNSSINKWSRHTKELSQFIDNQEDRAFKKKIPALWFLLRLITKRRVEGMNIEIFISKIMKIDFAKYFIKNASLLNTQEVSIMFRVFHMVYKRYEDLFVPGESKDLEIFSQMKLHKNIILLSLLSNVFSSFIAYVTDKDRDSLHKKCDEYMNLVRAMVKSNNKYIHVADVSSILTAQL